MSSSDPIDPRPTWRGQIPPVIDRETESLRDELVQAGSLLRDGMLKLQTFVTSMQQTIHALGEGLERLEAAKGGGERAAQLAALKELQTTAVQHVDEAVVGLQLEDILGQLLDYANRRVGGLSNVALAMAAILRQGNFPESHAALDELAQALAEVNRRAHDRAVAQESMTAGDIELF